MPRMCVFAWFYILLVERCKLCGQQTIETGITRDSIANEGDYVEIGECKYRGYWTRKLRARVRRWRDICTTAGIRCQSQLRTMRKLG